MRDQLGMISMLKVNTFSTMLCRWFWLALFIGPVSAGVIYTWVDENGVTHYSQQAPQQENIKAEKLYSEDLEQAKVGFIAPVKKAEATSEVNELEKSAALIKEKDAKQAQSICKSAKHNLDILTTHTKLIRQTSDSGESVAMTEEDRQASIAQQQERIKLFCDKK